MAVPADPTVSQLVSEAFKKAGELNPSSDLTTRGEGSWMEEIKNDIWKRSKKLKRLHVTAHGVMAKGLSRYSMPTDFSSDLDLAILDGNTGTAQAGSINTLTLAATETYQEGDILGLDLLINSGQGQASSSQITSYNSTTKVATVTPDFKASPSTSSGYMIVNKEYNVDQKHIGQYQIYKELSLGRPTVVFPIGDEDYGEMILNRPPDKAYGMRLRYYANLMKIDTSTTHFSTILLEYRNVFMSGLLWKAYQFFDDDRQENQWSRYQAELNSLILRETYGVDLQGLQDHVSDYM